MMGLLRHWGYLGAFVGIFIEEAGVPLPFPGDVFIVALGAAGNHGDAAFLMTVLIVVAAAVPGSATLLEISRRLGRPALQRVGHRIGYDEGRIARTERWLNTHGTMTVAFARLVPGLRMMVTVAAGALRMDRRSFLSGVAIAAMLWATLYYWLGYFLGASVTAMLETWSGRMVAHLPNSTEWLSIAVITGAGIVVIWLWRKRHR